MGQCNFCALKNIKAEAKKGSRKVVTLENSLEGSFEGGKSVYVVPSNHAGLPDRDKHFVVWFAQIPSHCCC